MKIIFLILLMMSPSLFAELPESIPEFICDERELFLSLISFAIFTWGIATKRYGTASIIIMFALMVSICLSQSEIPFPYGCLLSIVLFIVSLIMHGRAIGKNSPLFLYSPYNPNSKLPPKLKLALLILAIIVTLTTVIGLITK